MTCFGGRRICAALVVLAVAMTPFTATMLLLKGKPGRTAAFVVPPVKLQVYDVEWCPSDDPKAACLLIGRQFVLNELPL